jgi:hypothetical protein
MDSASKSQSEQKRVAPSSAHRREKRARQRTKDRDFLAISQGWDVSGPRWRIGWGGLPLETKVPSGEGSNHRR